MRYPILLVLLTAVSLSPVAVPSEARAADRGRAEADDRALLTRLKLEILPAAYRDGDANALERLLDARYAGIDGDGAVSARDEELDWVARHRLDDRETEYRIERFDFLADDVALIVGLGTVRRTVDGTLRVRQYRSTNVFVKRDGAWRSVASHVSMLPADAATPAP